MTQPHIRLVQEDVHLARELADRTYATFAAARGFYRNTPTSHLIGKLGEISAQRWVEAEGFETTPLFADATLQAEADLACNGYRIEVKTWDARWWPDWGRCVATGQGDALERKADAVLWLSIAAALGDSPVVTVHGWSTIKDVLRAPVRWTGPAGRKVKNHQLDLPDLRSSEALLEKLRGLVA